MLTAFDVGVGVLVLISAILATARGLTREILSLATWAGSAAIAIYMLLYHKDLVYPGLIRDETVAQIALAAGTFLVALIVLHLITMRIADFVVDSRIGPLDRTLGFIFGAARGVLIAVVIVIFAEWLVPELERQPWIGGNCEVAAAADTQGVACSKTLGPLQNLGRTLISLLPPDLETQVTNILEGNTGQNDTGSPADTGAPPDNGAPDEGTDAPEDDTPPADAPPAAGA